MLYDIAAMQFLYGANTSYNAGNDVYTFDPTKPFLRTIWDGGGVDTISVANFSKGCTIDLQAGHFSSIMIPSDSTAGYTWSSAPPVATYNGTNNLAIAYGCVIENAIGGSGNDVLIGNEADNRLDGGGGSDTLYGGAGTDTAVFHVTFAAAAIAWLAGESALAVSFAGSISSLVKLSGIEYLQFDDRLVASSLFITAPDTTAPTVTSFTPVGGATRIGVSSDIVLTFSEAIQRGSGTITLWNIAAGKAVETYDVATSANISIAGSTLTVNPTAALGNNTNYALLFDPGNIQDLAGNVYAGTRAYDFTTAVATVADLPFHIVATDHLDEGDIATFTIYLDAAITAPVTVYFSTQAGTASTGGGDYAGFSDRAITFTPGGPTSQSVTVQTLTDALTEGNENFTGVIYKAIGDFGSGNYLATSNVVTLIDKSAPDLTPPTVTGFSPQSGAANVSRSADIVLNFSEAITRGAGTIVISDTAGHVIVSIDAATSGMLTIAGSTLTINPIADLLDSTAYIVSLSAGSIKDIAGNAYGGTASYQFSTGIAPIIGTALADNLLGGAGNDSMSGLAGNDTFSGAAGNDSIDGGSGYDSALYAGKLANYTIAKSGANYTVSDRTGADGVDLLTNVESLRFADVTVNLTVQAIAAAAPAADVQRIIELYTGFFNRTPDADGMAYWIGQKVGGQSMTSIANIFYDAGAQYTSLTGISTGMSNNAFINLIYKNVLGRVDGADAGGLAYWSGLLNNGQATRGSVVQSILDSAHTFKGDATYGFVADLLDNKITVGKTIAIDLGIGYADPTAAVANGMAISAAITPTDISQALKLIGIAAADYHLT
jgi:hypothetical protein